MKTLTLKDSLKLELAKDDAVLISYERSSIVNDLVIGEVDFEAEDGSASWQAEFSHHMVTGHTVIG